MAKYRCEFCKFKFETKSANYPKKCPYCSREGTVAAEESAEELLRDVDDMVK